MATEKWTTPSAWTNAFTAATLDALGSGNAILSDLSIDNSASLNIFADVSINLGSAAFVAPNLIGVYLYPLNKDGTTFGDGRFASAASGPPSNSYQYRAIQITATTAVQEGSTGTPFVLPPGIFRFVIYNQGGVQLAGSGGNTCQYRTYNRSVA